MKKIICAFFVLAAIVHARAQGGQDVPTWTMTVRVIDEQGSPVTNATVKVAWHIPPPPGQSIALTSASGLTDSEGVFKVTRRSGSIEIMCGAEKAGYYSAGASHEFAKFKNSDPAKWKPAITLLLKRVVNPVPMYAKRLNTHVPAVDKATGFDLEAGDWIAPYGKGTRSDLSFTAHFDKKPDGESDFTLTVTFPKPGDGIQEFAVSEAEKASDLRSPQEAPADGYQPQWVQTDNRKPNSPIETNRDPNRNFFFRVRTVLDEQGNVKSAIYGKIYGDFMQFTYYLNPAPNDRRMEFNRKDNMLRGLESFEQVNQP